MPQQTFRGALLKPKHWFQAISVLENTEIEQYYTERIKCIKMEHWFVCFADVGQNLVRS